MSGYLQRLVERHTRERPSVRLRAPSRFEGELIGGLPEAEAEPAAPATPLVPFPASAPPSPRATPVEHPGAHADTAESVGRADRAVSPVKGRAAAADTPAQPPRAEPSPAGSAGTPTSPSPSAASTRPARQRSAPDRASGTRPPAGPRLTRHDAISPPHTRRQVATTLSEEPDVVHVHIGRVEVRAVVAAREPSRPVDRRPRPAPLSLERYLSGERPR
jgi:hypothetical protein